MVGSGSAYAPQDLIFFRRVMDEAVATLPDVMRTPVAKAGIARRILDCASSGERRGTQLLSAALTDHNTPVRPIGA